MKKYLHVLISAENKSQAKKIFHIILQKKLAIGGLMIEAPAQFLWKGKRVDMNYVNILTFTLAEYQKALIAVVEKVSVEEVPMISFSPLSGNKKFLSWIDKTIG